MLFHRYHAAIGISPGQNVLLKISFDKYQKLSHVEVIYADPCSASLDTILDCIGQKLDIPLLANTLTADIENT